MFLPPFLTPLALLSPSHFSLFPSRSSLFPSAHGWRQQPKANVAPTLASPHLWNAMAARPLLRPLRCVVVQDSQRPAKTRTHPQHGRHMAAASPLSSPARGCQRPAKPHPRHSPHLGRCESKEVVVDGVRPDAAIFSRTPPPPTPDMCSLVGPMRCGRQCKSGSRWHSGGSDAVMMGPT